MWLRRIIPRVISLQANDFELFGMPIQFAMTRDALDVRWKELQREAHPDRFAVEGLRRQNGPGVLRVEVPSSEHPTHLASWRTEWACQTIQSR